MVRREGRIENSRIKQLVRIFWLSERKSSLPGRGKSGRKQKNVSRERLSTREGRGD